MYNYFKTMKAIADLNPKEYTSIRELTIDIAMSNGYHKGNVTLKNGKVVERTLYNRPSTWDSTLVAKWFCFYEKSFYSEFLKHPELKDYYTTIMFRTFHILFNSLTMEKLTSDKAVTTLFQMCLGCRIGDAFYAVGSEKRLQGHLDKTDKRITMSSAINEMAYSLEGFYENLGKGCEPIDDSVDYLTDRMSDVVADARNKLKDNQLGLRLLDGMLYSDKKVSTKSIDKFLKLDKSALSAKDVLDLSNAWHTISMTLRSSLEADGVDVSKYNWEKIPKFSVSSERTSCIK